MALENTQQLCKLEHAEMCEEVLYQTLGCADPGPSRLHPGFDRMDGDNVFDDIFITYNVGGKNSEILLHDVFDGDTLIFSEQTAEVAAGWNFISFG